MIIRDRPSGLRLFFIVRGSILTRIAYQLAVTVLLAIAVTAVHGTLFNLKITLTPIPFSLIGLALAIFLGFRNSAAYDRYWEGRKLWGLLVLMTRSLTRQILTFVSPEEQGRLDPPWERSDIRVCMVYRLIAFTHALRHHLRGSDPVAELQAYLAVEEWNALRQASNKPDFLIQRMAFDLRRCLAEQRIREYFLARLDVNLTSLASVLAGCERIRNTPLPFSYTLLLHRTAYLYCFLLPFGLVDSIGFMTPFVVAIVSYTFFGLDALGDEIAEPFGTLANSLPLAAISRSVERDLREALGETDLPEPLQPVNYCLM